MFLSYNFLGTSINKDCIGTLKDKVQVIYDFSAPTNCASPLDLSTSIIASSPHYADILRPLDDCLMSHVKDLRWTPDPTTAFFIKQYVTLLSHPQAGFPLSIVTDASDTTVGTVLQ